MAFSSVTNDRLNIAYLERVEQLSGELPLDCTRFLLSLKAKYNPENDRKKAAFVYCVHCNIPLIAGLYTVKLVSSQLDKRRKKHLIAKANKQKNKLCSKLKKLLQCNMSRKNTLQLKCNVCSHVFIGNYPRPSKPAFQCGSLSKPPEKTKKKKKKKKADLNAGLILPGQSVQNDVTMPNKSSPWPYSDLPMMTDKGSQGNPRMLPKKFMKVSVPGAKMFKEIKRKDSALKVSKRDKQLCRDMKNQLLKQEQHKAVRQQSASSIASFLEMLSS